MESSIGEEGLDHLIISDSKIFHMGHHMAEIKHTVLMRTKIEPDTCSRRNEKEQSELLKNSGNSPFSRKVLTKKARY